jgi:hypothetical protein
MTTEELKNVATGLDELTAKGGPLQLLLGEVRTSNKLALRNVRLQIMSLVALFFCLVCLFLLSLIFYQGLTSLAKAEENISVLADRLSDTEFSVAGMEEKLEDAPKIVADDSGQLQVVATVKVDESFGEEPKNDIQKSVEEEVKKAEAEVDAIMAKRGMVFAQEKKATASLKPKSKAKAKKVTIPLDMWGARESE